MSEAKPRRSRLAQLKEKLEEDELNVEPVQLIQRHSKSEEVGITEKILLMTESIMKRMEAIEVQQTENIIPRITFLEEKIDVLTKNVSEILKTLKSQQ